MNVVDDLERRKSWFPWDDGKREIRLDGLGVSHVDWRVDHFDELLSQFLIISKV